LKNGIKLSPNQRLLEALYGSPEEIWKTSNVGKFVKECLNCNKLFSTDNKSKTYCNFFCQRSALMKRRQERLKNAL